MQSDISSRARRSESGFTLLEMLVVLTIIGLVSAFVGPRLIAQLDRSRETAALIQMRSLVSSLESLRIDLGRYPRNTEGLALLVRRPDDNAMASGWRGPYLDTDVPVDPWGQPYVYQAPADAAGRPLIGSLGSDGVVGGTGPDSDISFGGDRDSRAAS